MAGGGIRVSIPVGTKEMIQNIKEVTGNHSEDEILSMLEECGMDPDETTQRLLLQDPFHEVKRKRDKRKENLSNKDSAESRSRPGTHGRGNRGDRVISSARYTLRDAGGAKNASKRENGTKQVPEKAADAVVSTSQETKNKESAAILSSPSANDFTGAPSGSSNVVHAYDSPAYIGQPTTSSISTNKLESVPSPVDTSKNHGISFSPSLTSASSSEVQLSSLGLESGTDQMPKEQYVTENKLPSNSLGMGKLNLSDSSQRSRPTSAHSNNLGSRPSSNHSNRSKPIIGPQRGSNKEWKPKQLNPNPSQLSGVSSAPEIVVTAVEHSDKLLAQVVLPSEKETSRLQKKLEGLHISHRQHVIIPNHIQVPESERTKLSFGSFDAGFALTASYVTAPENENSSTPLSQTSQDIEETSKEKASSNQNTSAAEKEGYYPDKSELPSQAPENLSGDVAVSSNSVQEYIEAKPEGPLMPGKNQNSLVHTPNYGIGIIPPVLGCQVTPFENAESQARDASQVPGLVQQPLDPASYYAQFYPSSADIDGRVSPFFPPGVVSKYGGNITVLPPNASQSPQEAGNSVVLPTASPSPPPVNQAAGFMQSSIAVTQQHVPVFRPPAAMHISHYPPNYFPYGYVPPFYPPTIHQFLSNGAFAQQPQSSSIYPAPPPNAATGVKYTVPQYKTGSNPGNLTHIGMPSGYATYGSFPVGYNHGSATSAGNSSANEDLNPSQLKESNVYRTEQQSEALPVWIAGPGRDVPVSSFYNVPPQGQLVAFAPTQTAHGSLASIYHPTQAVTAANIHPFLQQPQPMAGAVDMVGPATNVFQQSQQTQINWPSNY